MKYKKRPPEAIIWSLSLIITFLLQNFINKTLSVTPPFIKFMFYVVIIYLAYRLLVVLENYRIRRILIPITPIRAYGAFNKNKTRKMIKEISSILIDLEYFDIILRESTFSRGNKWVILSSKMKGQSKRPKIWRSRGANIRPKIILNKGEFYLSFLKLEGDFVKKEAKSLYDKFKKIKPLRLKPLIT